MWTNRGCWDKKADTTLMSGFNLNDVSGPVVMNDAVIVFLLVAGYFPAGFLCVCNVGARVRREDIFLSAAPQLFKFLRFNEAR